jgi:hypothetical protein
LYADGDLDKRLLLPFLPFGLGPGGPKPDHREDQFSWPHRSLPGWADTPVAEDARTRGGFRRSVGRCGYGA